jgi:hypothetical protein
MRTFNKAKTIYLNMSIPSYLILNSFQTTSFERRADSSYDGLLNFARIQKASLVERDLQVISLFRLVQAFAPK